MFIKVFIYQSIGMAKPHTLAIVISNGENTILSWFVGWFVCEPEIVINVDRRNVTSQNRRNQLH